MDRRCWAVHFAVQFFQGPWAYPTVLFDSRRKQDNRYFAAYQLATSQFAISFICLVVPKYIPPKLFPSETE